jgi:hypothetical protein
MSQVEGPGPRSATLADRLIRLPDPDLPIFRVFPLWFLEEALRLRQLVLVAPSSWEDPLEVVGDAIAVNTRRGDRIEQVIINQSLPPAFAQCWSMTAESDTLLRADSRVVKDPHFRRNTCPRDEGVRVRSTPRKLLQALVEGNPSGLRGHWFLGSVKYLERKAVLQEIANAIGAHGLQVFEVPSNRAKLLLLKRDAFSHEAEVRAIFVQDGAERRGPIIQVPIKPSEVFDDISFDPRLETFERREREAVVRSLGYTGTISDTGLYQRTLLQVGLIGEGGEPGGGPPAA